MSTADGSSASAADAKKSKRGGKDDKPKQGLIHRLPNYTVYTLLSLAFVYYFWYVRHAHAAKNH
jgi:hypothetical protein